MANTFKNAGIAVSTTRTTLYVCPSASKAVIHALFLSNIDGTNNATITVEVTVDGGTTYRHIAKGLVIPANNTIILDKPINLEGDDVIAVTATATGDVEAVASILEVA